MNQTEFEKYRAALEAKQAELSLGLRNRDDIAIEKTPDALDEVQLAGERELAIRNLDRESLLLRSVKGALIRVAVDQVLHSLPGSRRSSRIRSGGYGHARRNAGQRRITGSTDRGREQSLA